MSKDQIDDDFDNWWEHEENMTSNNPYRKGSVLFWAWEGWVAGRKTEREACAEVAEQIEREIFDAVGDPRVSKFKPKIAAAIRARGQG
jgi:hypothetical protein